MPGVSAGSRARVISDVVGIANQAVRIVQPESQTNHGRYRRQGDIALFEIELDAQGFACRSTGLCRPRRSRQSRWRSEPAVVAGQAEAGNLPAVGQAWQIVLFLFLGAVVKASNSAGPSELGTATTEPIVELRSGHFLQHGTMGYGREAEATKVFRNDHAEKTVFLEVFPGLVPTVRRR